MKSLFKKIPIFAGICKCRKSGIQFVGLWDYIKVNYLNRGRHYYPISKGCIVQHPKNIYVGKNSILFRPGCYIQGEGQIYVGDYVRVTMFCTIMSTNHDVYNHEIKHKAAVKLHDYCWIGTRSIILAGVELGPKTVVAAGSVVTKSFPDGYCIIGGCPAKVIKYLDKEKVVCPKQKDEYYGMLTPADFKKKWKKFLDIENIDF